MAQYDFLLDGQQIALVLNELKPPAVACSSRIKPRVEEVQGRMQQSGHHPRGQNKTAPFFLYTGRET